MTRTSWKNIAITNPSGGVTAELALVTPDPLTCQSSPEHRNRVLEAAKGAGFTAELGRALDILSFSEPGSPRVLAIGLGPRSATGSNAPAVETRCLSIGGFILEAMTQHRLARVRLPDSAQLGGPAVLEAILQGALLHSFRLDTHASIKRKDFTPEALIVNDSDQPIAARALRTADAVNRARAWVEQPANLLRPPDWADEIKEVFTARKANVRILGPAELEQIGAGALLAVGRASEHGPRLLTVEWRGDPSSDRWTAALVGKGVTFDAGGLHLKARPNISKMKFDMAGGAAVLGALELAIARDARANLVAIVPMAENLIDALGYRPGDVLTSMSGLTVEVGDTDAEGRLVLADALTYALRTYQPASVIDIATLTGSITSVLHEEFAGLYCSDDGLAAALERAGQATDERVWRMPLDTSQDYLVESEVADVNNCGAPGFFGIGGGSAAAGAKFLEKFTRGTPWAHIDMAGTAWSTRRTARGNKGATGYGARLLDRWLRAQGAVQ